MTQLVCDMCGKVIHSRNFHNQVVVRYEVSESTGLPNLAKTVDLCPSCTASVEAFVGIRHFTE